MNLYQLFLFTRFADSSDEEESESAAVAKGVGKSTGNETDNEEKLYEEDDKDVPAIRKGMVQARVGQKLVKHNILKVFFVTDFVSVTLLLGTMMLNRNRLLLQ